MKIAVAHGMTKEEAKAWIDARFPDLVEVLAAAVTEAFLEFQRLPRWKRWLLWALAIPRYGPGWAFDKYRWWLRSRRRNQISPNT